MSEYRSLPPTGVIEQLLVESGIDQPGPELLAVLGALASMADRPVPVPSPALARRLGIGVPGLRLRMPRRTLLAAASAAIGLGASGAAAASDHRPALIRQIVDDVAHHSSRAPVTVRPGTGPTTTITAVLPPAPAPTAQINPSFSGEPEDPRSPSAGPSSEPTSATEPPDSESAPARPGSSDGEDGPEPSISHRAEPTTTRRH